MILSAILVLMTMLTPKIDSSEVVISVPIHFRWDGARHDRSYFDNNTATDSLLNVLANIGYDNINKIEVTGFSSPEGVSEHNVKLSKQRADAVGSLIRKDVPQLSSKVYTYPGGEGWALLRERVEADMALSVPTCNRILRFLDNKSISDDTRKWRLANWLGRSPEVGDIYKYLLRTHYRYLRCAMVTIHFDERGGEKRPPLEQGPPDSKDQEAEPTEPEQSVQPVDSVVMAEPAVIEESIRIARPDYPIIGISTNLPYDFTYLPGYGLTSIPSFSLEYYPRNGRFSFGADVEWPMWRHWDSHDFLQINNITLWARRYFRPKTDDHFKGSYAFGNINAAQYGIGFDDKGWEGEGIGASLGIGHKWMLGRSRFFIDTGIGLGVFWSKYDPYVWGDEATGWYYYDYTGKPESFQPRRKRLLWFGPTRLYFSIGYDIHWRKRR